MKQIREKHSLIMRWTHWVNFPVLTLMIWSGLLIYWANDAYGISILGNTIFQFFPQWFYNFLNLKQRLAEGMAFHFFFMWFFFINGFLYIVYTIFSGAWRSLVPKRTLLVKPCKSYYMICTFVKPFLHSKNIMPHSV